MKTYEDVLNAQARHISHQQEFWEIGSKVLKRAIDNMLDKAKIPEDSFCYLPGKKSKKAPTFDNCLQREENACVVFIELKFGKDKHSFAIRFDQNVRSYALSVIDCFFYYESKFEISDFDIDRVDFDGVCNNIFSYLEDFYCDKADLSP